jgi:hypothetical protein
LSDSFLSSDAQNVAHASTLNARNPHKTWLLLFYIGALIRHPNLFLTKGADKMQDYSNPQSRNTSRAVGQQLKSGAAIGGGGNQNQGKGELPSKVSVPMPGTNERSASQGKPGSKVKTPVGFGGGVIPGKI